MSNSRNASILVATCLLAGCGTIMHGSRQDVSIQSSAEGTTVNTSPLTVSVGAPGTLSLERKNNYVLTFSAPGYASTNVAVTNSIGIGTVVADVLFTGLVGVVVDGMTGSWYGLNPETANVTLVKRVGTVGPNEIHIQIGHGKLPGQLGFTADAAGVAVEAVTQ